MVLGRYIAIMALTCAVLHGVLTGLSFLLFPAQAVIDTGTARASLYETEPRYLAFQFSKLSHPGPRIILLGSSTVREGLRPAELTERLGGTPVHNLAPSAADVREINEIVDATFEHVPRSSWHELTFVVGIWYATFVPAAHRWPDDQTDLDKELLRYRLYTQDGAALHRQIPQVLEPAYGLLLRPVLLASRAYHTSRKALPHRHDNPDQLVITDKNTFVLSAQQRRQSQAFWHAYMGPQTATDKIAIAEFRTMLEKITSHGSLVVILDLPIPRWHSEAVPYDKRYVEDMRPVLEDLRTRPGIRYASLRGHFTDGQFFDAAHPRPRFTHLWADLAAAAIASP